MATKIIIGGDLSNNASYSPPNLPVNGDDLYLTADTPDITDGWTAMVAVTLTSLHVQAGWTGKCDADADEYIQVGATNVYIGEHLGVSEGAGSPRLKLDIQGNTTIEVFRTSRSTTDANMPPVRLLVDSGTAKLYVRKGGVGVGIDVPGETGELDEIHVGYDTNRDGDADVIVGPGITLGGLLKTGGKCVLHCGATGVTNEAGELRTEGTGAVGAWTHNGGTGVSNSSGTVSQVNLNGGEFDTTRSSVSRTLTAVIHKGGTLRRDSAYVALTTYTLSGRLSAQVAAA